MLNVKIDDTNMEVEVSGVISWDRLLYIPWLRSACSTNDHAQATGAPENETGLLQSR